MRRKCKTTIAVHSLVLTALINKNQKKKKAICTLNHFFNSKVNFIHPISDFQEEVDWEIRLLFPLSWHVESSNCLNPKPRLILVEIVAY